MKEYSDIESGLAHTGLFLSWILSTLALPIHSYIAK